MNDKKQYLIKCAIRNLEDGASLFDKEDVEILAEFADRENKHPMRLRMCRMSNKDKVDEFLRNGLLHEFEGDVFLSVTPASLENIKRRLRESPKLSEDDDDDE